MQTPVPAIRSSGPVATTLLAVLAGCKPQSSAQDPEQSLVAAESSMIFLSSATCPALIAGDIEQCDAADCRGVLSGNALRCGTGDCTAIVRRQVDQCTNPDCEALTAAATGDPETPARFEEARTGGLRAGSPLPPVLVRRCAHCSTDVHVIY